MDLDNSTFQPLPPDTTPLEDYIAEKLADQLLTDQLALLQENEALWEDLKAICEACNLTFDETAYNNRLSKRIQPND